MVFATIQQAIQYKILHATSRDLSRAQLGPAGAPIGGSAQDFSEPEPPQAGPRPGLSGRAGLAHH
jgi:hypothetical protein